MTADKRSGKVSTGPNTRPKDETISQTGRGIPDDTGARNPDIEEAARGEHSPEEVFGDRKRRQDVGGGRRQPDPAEGDRERVERELARQSGRKKA